MKIETSSRGITTYGCSRGCSDYQYVEKNVQAAAATISTGTPQNIPAATGVFAQTAAMT
jgi:hypothetical protein